ncbi:MAG: hypothetical protein QMC80_06685 [Thermoplasmatales archaeon]|nr:hypothetical protein [Thermoplasmatales archaeon]
MRKYLLPIIILCLIVSAGCIEWGGGKEKETPTAHAVVTYSEGKYCVIISSISNPATVSAIMYIIKDSNSKDVRYGDVDVFSCNYFLF